MVIDWEMNGGGFYRLRGRKSDRLLVTGSLRNYVRQRTEKAFGDGDNPSESWTLKTNALGTRPSHFEWVITSKQENIMTIWKSVLGIREGKAEAMPNFGLALRASEIAMGFIFFTGGWRRFYNVPAKHDIESVKSLAGKLTEAAPGSPIEGVIHWLLYKPALAEFSIYFMSTAEVLVGLGLIFGFMTRIAGLGSAGLNLALMLIFGWMGYECLDEYTMAALGFAISISVIIHGTSGYSLDSRLRIDPFGRSMTKKLAIGLTVMSVLFTVGFYQYYFGFFNFNKRTSSGVYSIVAESTNQADVATLYVNAGGSSSAAYVKSITFTLDNGSEVRQLPEEVEVLRSHFEPWSNSGIISDGVLRLRLGSKVDIRIPSGAVSAEIDLIDNKTDPVVTFK